MSPSSHEVVQTGSNGSRGRVTAFAVLACACLALFAALFDGSADAAKEKTTVVLGQTATQPDPSCPGLPCQAVGSVTGFQVNNGQRSFFNGFFGTPPQAGLAILRRVPGTNPPRYNLRSKGAIKVLTPYLGQ